MANELSISSGISGKKGFLTINEEPGQNSVTMTGERESAGVQDIGSTIHELLSVHADFGAIGWGWFRNLDLVNRIKIGLGSPAIGTPGAPTVTPQGTTGTTSYSYRISAIDADGETLASAAGTTATGNAALTSGNFNRVTWAAVARATGYRVYGRVAAGELLIATLGLVTTYDDTGTVTPAGALPATDTTGFHALADLYPGEHFPIPLAGKVIYAKGSAGTPKLKYRLLER